MAASDLKAFLIKLDNELMEGQQTQTQALQKYRTSKGDKKAANLTYNPDKITHALKVLGGDVPGELQTEYDALVTKLSASMLEDFLALEVKFPSEVVVTEYGGGVISAFIVKKGDRNNYNTLKDSYNATLDKFYVDFLNLIERPGGLVRENAKGKERIYSPEKGTKLKFRAQTHEDGGSNVLNQMNDAVYAAIASTNAASVKATPDIKAELRDWAATGRGDASFILKIIKDGEMGVIEYGIASSWLNSKQGGGEEQNLRQALAKAIESLSAFIAPMGGSDSLIRAHRKKLIKEMVKPFLNRKGIKVKHEDFKIKENKKPEKLTKKAGKTTLAKVAAGKLASKKKLRRTGKRKTRAPRMALKNILSLLNAKLPQQVVDNMGAPRLENQTGRFAQSVRAIDVQETAKGFKSIGYMYQKNPYQVFESTSGTRFSDAARDPRPLIDTSIREIVAQFGLGRLYTRRL